MTCLFAIPNQNNMASGQGNCYCNKPQRSHVKIKYFVTLVDICYCCRPVKELRYILKIILKQM